MNRLKKKAWTELLFNLLNLLPIWAVLRMAKANTQMDWEILGGLVGLTIIIAIVMILWIRYIWKSSLEQFDEREKEMYLKAMQSATHICASYFIGLSFIIFLLIGGGGSVPVVSLPLLVFSGIFLGGIVQPGIILSQCVREDRKNDE